MDWQQLKSFYTIVKLGSMTRAADAMFRTQSALSQQIGKLEAELRCTLFKRIGKSFVHLTDEGEALYAFADEVFLREREFLDQVDTLSNLSSGSLYLAAPYAVLEFLLGDVLHDFSQKFPQISLHIFHETPQGCIERLLNGEVDFAFVHDSTIPARLERYPWKKGRYMFVVSKEHPLAEAAREGKPGLKEILQYPLNVPSRHSKFSARERLDKICYDMKLKYRIALETSNVLLNVSYAVRNIGISFALCYDPIIEQFSDRVFFIAMPDIFPDETISIVMKKRSLCTHTSLFLQFVLDG